MKQGTTPTKRIKIDVENSSIESVIFTIKSGTKLLSKRYPDDVEYKDGCYLLNLSQEDTKDLEHKCQLEAQINLLDGAVAKTVTEAFLVARSIYTEIQGDHAGGVEENDIALSSSDVIVSGERNSPVYAEDVIGLDELIPKVMTAQELRRIIEG